MTLSYMQIRLVSLLSSGYQLTIRRSVDDSQPLCVDVVLPTSGEVAGYVPWRLLEDLLRMKKVALDTGDVATAKVVVAP